MDRQTDKHKSDHKMFLFIYSKNGTQKMDNKFSEYY